MVNFRSTEEGDYFSLLARKAPSRVIQKLLNGGDINSSEEATELAKLFWAIADKSIELEKAGELDEFPEGAEYWNEKIMNSISGYLERLGYEDELDRVTDEQ